QEKTKKKGTGFFFAGDYFTGPYISSLTKGKACLFYTIDAADHMQCGEFWGGCIFKKKKKKKKKL
ncbi:hypothetical protein SE11_22490, partial [Salmonella enterica subsp. enterica serovar Braenderup]